LGTSRRSIKLAIEKGTYSFATEDQVLNEKNRRYLLQSGPILGVTRKYRSGVKQAVIINGIVYDSVSCAAEALGVSVQAISASIKKNRKGYSFFTPD
jgi:hypothetical protein